MTLAMLCYVSAILNALYATLNLHVGIYRLGFYSSVTNVTYLRPVKIFWLRTG